MSSQISVPAPSIFIKAILSAKKHAVLLWLLLIARPSAALLFVSSGTSALEKETSSYFVSFWGQVFDLSSSWEVNRRV